MKAKQVYSAVVRTRKGNAGCLKDEKRKSISERKSGIHFVTTIE